MESNNKLLVEIRDMLKVLMDDQQQLMRDVKELKEEQRRLRDEVRLSNFVLNNMAIRNEIIN